MAFQEKNLLTSYVIGAEDTPPPLQHVYKRPWNGIYGLLENNTSKVFVLPTPILVYICQVYKTNSKALFTKTTSMP